MSRSIARPWPLACALCLFAIGLPMACRGRNAKQWSFRIEIRDPDSRSTRDVGLLEYGSRRIPRALGTVVTPIGQFTPSSWPGFGAPTEEGEFWPSNVSQTGVPRLISEPRRGAFLSPEWIRKNTRTTHTAKTSSVPVNDAELKIGWYKAGFNMRKRQTPDEWMWVMDSGVWLSPRNPGDRIPNYKKE